MKYVLSLLAVCCFVSGVDAARPNILIVIADDMTWRDCQPYGNDEVDTPHLAKLASQGMKFNACFTSTAMCAPTRAQLYTGMFPIRNGAYPNHSAVREGTKSIPHHFKSLGYRVGLIGKTHFKPARSFPFERLAGKGGASDTKKISEFVNRDKEQPYCLVVASNQPHSPWTVGPQGKYKPDELSIPPFLEDTPATRETLAKYYAEIEYLDGQVGDCMKIVDESGQADDTIFVFTSEQGSALPFAKWTCYDLGLKTGLIVRWPGHIKAGSENSAMVQYVDLVPTLIEAADADPTKIDTGRPEGPDGGSGFDGKSFLSVLLGRKDAHRKFVFGAHTTRGIINGSMSYPVRSVRSDSLKLIQNLSHESAFSNVNTGNGGGGGVWQSWIEAEGKTVDRARFYTHRPAEELYDLAKDPYELHNVITDPAYADQAEVLRQQLAAWMKQQKDRGVKTEALAGQRKKTPGAPQKKPNTGRKKNKASKTGAGHTEVRRDE
ncbi:MAG: sulfatase [Planctomycetes bacterium]|nr:sulfatase [Planctomycetota bacterium]